MKRYLLSTFTIAAAALLVTSCNDEMDNGLKTGDEGTVTFTAQLPSEMGTRAFADGLTAKHLQYAVYEAGQSTPLKVFGDETTVVGEAEMNNLKQTVSLKLTTGKTYDVIFWAADNSAKKPYTFDPLTQTVKIKYTNVYSNNDICDAFFKKETITVSGNQNVDVKLTRPFAQVNIGTDDFDAATIAGLNLTQTQVKATAGDILNLATGKMEGTEATRTFKMKAIPTADDGAFPVAGYKYLLMAYIPISDTKETVDMTFGYNGKSTFRSFTNVPLQRNYRTNIYGSLLTNSVDFNVVIEPAFSGEFAHEVVSASTFAALKAAVANGQSVDAEKTLVLSGGQSETLNLGDLSISNKNNIWSDSDSDWSLLSVRENSSLTITSGAYIAKANDCFAVDVQDGGHLVIEDGHFNGNVHAVYVLEGVAEIKGGTFEVQQKYSDADKADEFVLNCYDANRENGTAKIIVTGGTFIGFNPGDCKAEGNGTNFVAPGYASIPNGTAADGRTIWKVVPAVEATTAEGLKTALTTRGKIVALGQDLEYASSISPASNTSLVMKNGAVFKSTNDDSNNINTLLSISETGVKISGNGTLEAAPNRPNHTSAVIEVRTGGSVDIYGNLTFDAKGGSKANNAIRIFKGTANIHSGYFHTVGGSPKENSSECILIGYYNTDCYLNITGGIFESDGDATYLINCMDDYKKRCHVKVMGGTFVGFNPADNTADGAHTNYVAPGYKSVETTYNGKQAWKVVKE